MNTADIFLSLPSLLFLFNPSFFSLLLRLRFRLKCFYALAMARFGTAYSMHPHMQTCSQTQERFYHETAQKGGGGGQKTEKKLALTSSLTDCLLGRLPSLLLSFRPFACMEDFLSICLFSCRSSRLSSIGPVEETRNGYASSFLFLSTFLLVLVQGRLRKHW